MIKLVYEKKGKFDFNSILPHHRTTIIGKIGTGKSVLTDKILNHLSKRAFVVLIDTKGEYEHLTEFQLENLIDKRKGLFRVTSLDYRGYIIDDNQVLAEFFSDLMVKQNKKQRKDNKKLTPYVLAIEEVGNVIRKHGRLYDVMPKFAVLLQQGRSLKIGYLGTTQRPAEIHTTILSQSHHVLSFQVTSRNDLEAMKTYIDADKYLDLNRFQFYHVNHAENYIKHCYKLYLTQSEKNYYFRVFGES